MNPKSDITQTHIKEGNFIEIYRLEDIDDYFEAYHRYDLHQVLWFTRVEGDKTYFIDFKDHPYDKDQIVIVYPGQIDHIYSEVREGYLFSIDNETMLNINQRINSEYLSGYFSNVFIKLDTATKRNLETLVELMKTEVENENRFLLLEDYMSAFLFQVSQLFEKSVDPSLRTVNSTVAELLRLIDIHFREEQVTDFYARKLGVTIKKLNSIALKGAGRTVKHLLQERLLLEIKREIRLNRKNLKEIAFDLGFSEPSYLSRFFKKHTSISPALFRQKGK